MAPGVGPGQQLGDQPGLADARLANHVEHRRRAVVEARPRRGRASPAPPAARRSAPRQPSSVTQRSNCRQGRASRVSLMRRLPGAVILRSWLPIFSATPTAPGSARWPSPPGTASTARCASSRSWRRATPGGHSLWWTVDAGDETERPGPAPRLRGQAHGGGRGTGGPGAMTAPTAGTPSADAPHPADAPAPSPRSRRPPAASSWPAPSSSSPPASTCSSSPSTPRLLRLDHRLPPHRRLPRRRLPGRGLPRRDVGPENGCGPWPGCPCRRCSSSPPPRSSSPSSTSTSSTWTRSSGGRGSSPTPSCLRRSSPSSSTSAGSAAATRPAGRPSPDGCGLVTAAIAVAVTLLGAALVLIPSDASDVVAVGPHRPHQPGGGGVAGDRRPHRRPGRVGERLGPPPPAEHHLRGAGRPPAGGRRPLPGRDRLVDAGRLALPGRPRCPRRLRRRRRRRLSARRRP